MANNVTRVQCKRPTCNFVLTHVFQNIALQAAHKHADEQGHECSVEALVIPQRTQGVMTAVTTHYGGPGANPADYFPNRGG